MSQNGHKFSDVVGILLHVVIWKGGEIEGFDGTQNMGVYEFVSQNGFFRIRPEHRWKALKQRYLSSSNPVPSRQD